MKAPKRTAGEGWELLRGRSAEELLPRRSSAAPADQQIKIAIEKRAKGKVVTLARGFLLVETDLQALARKLKAACGTGGTSAPCLNDLDGGTIELQGEHEAKLRALREKAGYGTV